jgi:hypothetical protein
MRKPIYILSGVLLLASLSCQLLIPQNTPQQQITLEVATVPIPQLETARPEATQEQPPTPTTPLSTATQPPTPTMPVILDTVSMMFWNVTIRYDPAIWRPAGTDGPLTLTNQQISPCSIYEQGPTEPPAADREVTLGPVTYQVAELEAEGNPAHWYMAINGPQGPFTDGIPTLVISSSPEQFEQCRTSAEEVFATMR